MNEAQASRPIGPRLGHLAPVALALALVLGIVLVGFFVVGQRQQALRASVSGMDGLQDWLSSQEISAQSFAGGWQFEESSVGLLVMPLYDSDLTAQRRAPQTTEDLIFQQDEYDLFYDTVVEKAGRVPTLIILPKWRSGLRLTGLGHPALLINGDRTLRNLRRLTGDSGLQLSLTPIPFTEFPYRSTTGERLRARLYVSQTFASDACDPIIGTADAMILGDCPLPHGDVETRVLVLSDPDLFNNHGLTLGDNAWIARDFLGARSGDGNLLIDYSRVNWMIDGTAIDRRERSWSDLARFFSPPFTILWVGGALTLALFIWHATVRSGPLRGETTGPAASRDFALSARARLMRLSDQDGALLADYARARIAAVATHLLGPGYSNDQAAFLRYLHRRFPDHAHRIETSLDTIAALPARISASEAIGHVDDLERHLEHLSHDT